MEKFFIFNNPNVRKVIVDEVLGTATVFFQPNERVLKRESMERRNDARPSFTVPFSWDNKETLQASANNRNQ